MSTQAHPPTALVIGAGVIGLSTAITLRQHGWRVTVAAADSGTGIVSTVAGEVAKLWLEQYRMDAENGINSLGSVDTYSDHLRNHVLPTLGNLRLIEVKPHVIQTRGKGTVRNSGKSETASRDIPLPGWCVQMLITRRDALGKVDPDKPIFANSNGGYWNASNLNNRYWLTFRKRSGYEWIIFHTLRKTVGTLLDEARLTARQIADLLGHSHPSMTLNTYTGRGQASRASAKALDSVFVPKT